MSCCCAWLLDIEGWRRLFRGKAPAARCCSIEEGKRLFLGELLLRAWLPDWEGREKALSGGALAARG